MVQNYIYWWASCTVGGKCIVLEVLLYNLLTSLCNFVPCDRVFQRAYSPSDHYKNCNGISYYEIWSFEPINTKKSERKSLNMFGHFEPFFNPTVNYFSHFMLFCNRLYVGKTGFVRSHVCNFKLLGFFLPTQSF